MSTGAIVAIAVAVVVVLALLFVLLPRMRARRAQRRLIGEREHAAEAHRTEAEHRTARARLAEREAERQRAEAQLHETRAELHERGLADEELGREPSTRRTTAAGREEQAARDDAEHVGPGRADVRRR